MANGAESVLLEIGKQLIGIQEIQNDDNRSSEVVYLIPNELRDNPLNAERIIEQEDVDHLADSLLIDGLQQPLVVTPHEDKKLYLVSGHRRLRAIKKLFKENKSFSFADKQMIDKVPCIIRRFDSPLQERISVLVGNNHKDESVEEKVSKTVKLAELYEIWRKEYTDVSKAPPLTRNDFISTLTGYSDRSVKMYLKQAGKTRSYERDNSEKLFLDDLAYKIGSKLGTKVKAKGKSLVISFRDADDINRILEILGLENIVNE